MLTAVFAAQALQLIEYLLRAGPPQFINQTRKDMLHISTLKDFNYIDKDGEDQGVNSACAAVADRRLLMLCEPSSRKVQSHHRSPQRPDQTAGGAR
jgi:hypothetical protein